MTTTRPDMPERQFVLGPEQVRVTILTTGAETGGRHDLTDSWLPAGSMTPLHLHTRYEERIWVASGSLTVWAGPDKVVLRSGDYLLIPTRVPHTIQSGPEDTHALHISTPAGFAELVARAGTPAHLLTPETQPDLDLFMAGPPTSATSSSARREPCRPTSTTRERDELDDRGRRDPS
jgi:mannose-6-phosphate isomerase-like protein (cupin superfamily)